jgi:hypothetical protein
MGREAEGGLAGLFAAMDLAAAAKSLRYVGIAAPLARVPLPPFGWRLFLSRYSGFRLGPLTIAFTLKVSWEGRRVKHDLWTGLPLYQDN